MESTVQGTLSFDKILRELAVVTSGGERVKGKKKTGFYPDVWTIQLLLGSILYLDQNSSLKNLGTARKKYEKPMVFDVYVTAAR